MKTFKKAFFCVYLVMVCVGAFTGCHTAHGLGEDIEDAGESLQEKTK